MNLRKIKWLIFGTYHPPSQPVEYFFKHVGYALDAYGQTHKKFSLGGDFNAEKKEPCWTEFLTKYDSKSLAEDKTCFKNSENPRCIDLFITNNIGSFQKTTAVASGLSDFHTMIVTVCKASFQQLKPNKIIYRNYKNFDLSTFKNGLRLKLQSIKSYESFEQVFLEALNKHAPLKKKFLRANHVPYMKKSLCKAIMRRPDLEIKHLKNRTIENKAKYKKQKNF